MRHLLNFIVRVLVKHKILYTKTLKGDLMIILTAVIISLIVSYLGLAILGGGPVELVDVVVTAWYILLGVAIAYAIYDHM